MGENVLTTGCGRTDTGVHAKKFYAHFNTALAFDKEQIIYQLNAMLPLSIAVQEIFEVADDAHARFTATSRTYNYFIHQQKDPFSEGISWFYPHPADIEQMNIFAKILFEYTDFSAFSKSNTQTFTNNCKIMIASWSRINDQLVFEIKADRFLRNMVRAIVGTLLKAGAGKLSEKDFREILDSKQRSNAGASVPAHGLFLTDVEYPFIKNQ